MGPFAVELLDEAIKAVLLPEVNGCGQLCRFIFLGEMHPLVAAVLMRAAGTRP